MERMTYKIKKHSMRFFPDHDWHIYRSKPFPWYVKLAVAIFKYEPIQEFESLEPYKFVGYSSQEAAKEALLKYLEPTIVFEE